MTWRLWLITFVIAVSYSALLFNIYNLQIEKGNYYAVRAASQNRVRDYQAARRGNIYFRDKNDNLIPAAINREYPVVYAVPKEIENPVLAAEKLAPIVKTAQQKIQNSLTKPNDLYELLLAKATEDQVRQIKALAIKGIYIDSQFFRFYPFGELAAHLLGYVGPNETDGTPEGRYGLELLFDGELQKGDLVLTIDRNIQAQAENILRGLIEKYGAAGGTVIVQEPKTGKLLALGNFPAFDPNKYSESPVKNFLNPAAQAIYEPGSVFKVITMSAGIDSGKITPETTYYDTGALTLNGKTIKNWDLEKHGPYGRATMTQVIEKSINTGAVFAEKQTGHDIFYNYLLKFGFDRQTGVELPGELSGKLGNLKTSSRDINFATASFGQGIAITPMQIVNAISAIANRGLLMKPFLAETKTPEIIRRVITEETANKVTAMMVSAVKKAEIAQIPGYEIAGKTGTAQMPDLKYGGYSDYFIHGYAGFAPATDPRFTILIKIDKLQGESVAGATVVPAFRELAQFILNYYNIPADNL